MDDFLYYDTSTRTYFKSNAGIIHDSIRDIFYEIYLENPKGSKEYVDLIRELQRRLGIPEINDEKLCELYSFWNGRFLDVQFEYGYLSKGTIVTIIRYA